MAGALRLLVEGEIWLPRAMAGLGVTHFVELVCGSAGGDWLAARKRELHDQRALQPAEIVVRHDGNDGFATVTTHTNRLYVVDIQSVGCFEQDLALNESTWLDLARRHAADAHLDSLVVTESPLENEEPAVGQLGGIGNVKASSRFTAIEPG